MSATECPLACTPFPASEIDTAFALLFTTTPPLALPAPVGEKFALSTAACPAATVVFAPTPVAENCDPLTATLEIVTSEFPVLVSVTACELLLPSNTSPKLSPELLGVSTRIAVTLVPFNASISGEFGALLVSITEPVALPFAAGANSTLNVALCPAAIVSGVVSPLVVNPAPLTAALEIVTLAVPLFCRVIVCELLDPVATFGKLALLGVAASAGCVVDPGAGEGFPEAWLDAVTNPAHPLPIPHTNSASIALRTILLALSRDAPILSHPFFQPDPWADIFGASLEVFPSRQNCPEGQN